MSLKNILLSGFAVVAAAATTVPSRSLAQQATNISTEQPVILSISGSIRQSQPFEMTRADLEQLPRSVIRTSTPWHDGVQTFEGVSLADLLTHVGGKGKLLKVTALNAYRTEIPVEDTTQYKPILAWLRNGAAMSVRDKGPLFIIYPYDSDPSMRTEVVFGRSAWQVRSMAVE